MEILEELKRWIQDECNRLGEILDSLEDDDDEIEIIEETELLIDAHNRVTAKIHELEQNQDKS